MIRNRNHSKTHIDSISYGCDGTGYLLYYYYHCDILSSAFAHGTKKQTKQNFLCQARRRLSLAFLESVYGVPLIS